MYPRTLKSITEDIAFLEKEIPNTMDETQLDLYKRQLILYKYILDEKDYETNVDEDGNAYGNEDRYLDSQMEHAMGCD